MAKLTGVQRNLDVITHDGVTYIKTEGPARVGDIIMAITNEYADVWKGDYFAVTECRGGIVGFFDGNEDVRGIDDIGNYRWSVSSGEFERYRRVANETEVLRIRIEKKTQEIAELQRLLDEQETIKVGDFVLLVGESHSGVIPKGDIAKVENDDLSDVPYNIAGVLGGRDWAVASSVKKISPEEARKLLHEKVDEALGV